jgi:hypothetical protein
MTTATILQVADSLVALINASSLGQWATASRKYRVDVRLEELTDPTIAVVPASESSTRALRGFDNFEMAVDVGILQKLTPDANGQFDDAELDALMARVEELVDLVRDPSATHPGAFPNAVYLGVESPGGLYNDEHLEHHNQFTAVRRILYRVQRPPSSS